MKGDATRDASGNFVNPCVAWQIVDGICTIVREEYFDHYQPSLTVKQAVENLGGRCDEFTVSKTLTFCAALAFSRR